jgi:enoyl-CoA hydratase/carnithine racemase
MSEDVDITRAGGVLHLHLNRPAKKNAITQAMYAALAEALETLDDSIRVVAFSGAGDCFSAGNDLKDFLAAPPQDGAHPTLRFIRALPKVAVPMIAAVQGPAVGIGTTLLLHCDLVVAASNASFSVPFVKLGLVPEAGSSLLLPRLIGTHRAAAMLLLGEPINAATAERLGLVNQLVEPEALSAALDALIAKLLALPPAALRATKALLHGHSRYVAERIDEELVVLLDRLKSDELKEAATAFLEKRPPDFSRFA